MQTNQVVIQNVDVHELCKTIANEVIQRLQNPLLQTESLNSEQVKKLLGISHTTLQTWRDNGIIPFKKIGNKVFYLKSDVLKLLTPDE